MKQRKSVFFFLAAIFLAQTISAPAWALAWLYGAEEQVADQPLSVAIIGAGPSGLAAASQLIEKGYKPVVFEATGDVGGKVKTIMYGGRPYDMGAVVAPPDYHVILRIAKELNIPLTDSPVGYDITPDGKIQTTTDPVFAKYGKIELLNSFFNFRWFVKENAEWIYGHGFDATPASLFVPYEQFAAEQKVMPISDAYRPLMVGCGYGYAEDVPAAYWIRLMKTMALEMTEYSLFASNPQGFLQAFPQGWQNMWRQLAHVKNIHVELNSPVSNLVRHIQGGKHKIDLTVNGQVYTFDRVINTVPHLESKFADHDPEETAIFSQVQTEPYKTTLIEIDGFPRNAHFFPRAYSYKYGADGRLNYGNIVAISNYDGSNLYQVYQIGSESMSTEDLREILLANLDRMKVRPGKIVAEELWNYFPIFGAKAFNEGIPQRLAQMQGQGGLYRTGALMEFEDTEAAAGHAEYIVKTYF